MPRLALAGAASVATSCFAQSPSAPRGKIIQLKRAEKHAEALPLAQAMLVRGNVATQHASDSIRGSLSR